METTTLPAEPTAENLTIVRLGRADKDAVLDVLCASFRDYPAMRFMLHGEAMTFADADEARRFDDHLRALVGFFVEARLDRDWPILGVRDHGADGDRLVAAALVSGPEYIPWSDALEATYARVEATIGEEAVARMERFEAATKHNRPDTPCHYLGMLGVLPSRQGQGHGRVLLDAIRDLSIADPASEAVILSTESPPNVALYEHVGYRVHGVVEVGPIRSWTMVLPTV